MDAESFVDDRHGTVTHTACAGWMVYGLREIAGDVQYFFIVCEGCAGCALSDDEGRQGRSFRQAACKFNTGDGRLLIYSCGQIARVDFWINVRVG